MRRSAVSITFWLLVAWKVCVAAVLVALVLWAMTGVWIPLWHIAKGAALFVVALIANLLGG